MAFHHVLCTLYSAQSLVLGIRMAAKAGRLLPRLTLILPVHAIIHTYWINATLQNNNRALQNNHSNLRYDCNSWFISISRYILIANVTCCILGYITLVLLYKHSVQTIFNRNIPHYHNSHNSSTTPPRAHPAIQSFNTHLLLLRPIEILFRFCTAPLRVLPDVIILGETRCGTTNLCAHLVQLSKLSSSQQNLQQQEKIQRIKCYTPFCAWAVPELDHKESFYFVGHYCGIVHPYYYRMAFPLKLTRWYEEYICNNIFVCFDGCAQYLTSPTTPYLIATAYSNNTTQLLPVLVACIREPVDQAISWFYYEKNAIQWGESMGLTEWNTNLRSTQYPPTTIASAIQYSMSDYVTQLYLNAEKLVSQTSHDDCTPNTTRRIRRLPSWAITWPGGQLSVVGRSGNYARNIQRYNQVFSEASEATDNEAATTKTRRSSSSQRPQPTTTSATTRNIYLSNKFGHVHTVPIEYQSNMTLLQQVLRPILSDIIKRCSTRKQVDYAILMTSMNAALDNYIQRQNDDENNINNNSLQCRNSSTVLNIEYGLADTIEVDRALLSQHYKVESQWYAKLLQGLQYEKDKKKE